LVADYGRNTPTRASAEGVRRRREVQEAELVATTVKDVAKLDDEGGPGGP
jgi:hypothetical protein